MLIARARRQRLDLTVAETRYRGHATELAAAAHADGFDLVVVLGGDGTVNEAVNGLLDADDGKRTGAPDLPAARGRSRRQRERLRPCARPAEQPGRGGRRGAGGAARGRRRTVGLGQALWDDRAATSPSAPAWGSTPRSSGPVERLRRHGPRGHATLYMRTALRHFSSTDRRHAAITLSGPGEPPPGHIFLAIVSNTSPWTYLGSRPVDPTPRASFDDRPRPARAAAAGPAVDAAAAAADHRRRDTLPARPATLVQLHDVTEFTLRAGAPGVPARRDYLGERRAVTFRSDPEGVASHLV